MKVWTKNGDVTLTKTHYVGGGGEGHVYAKDSVAYKIYSDPKKMIPIGKIQELASIKNKNVIRPQEVLLNNKRNPIGYSMRFVKDTYALCQLFTKAFRDREGLNHAAIYKLVQCLQNMIADIHRASVLVVDLNEMNFLVDRSFNEIYAIDVDSYQTKSYPATALMESVRDRHAHIFSENTDWFSFGILAFQMMIGIHPFKGKHPSLKTLDDRMQKNISVLNKNVTIPRVCYPFTIIPTTYLDWFKAIFDDGKRLPPPTSLVGSTYVVPTFQKILSTNQLDIQELYEVNENIINILFVNGNRAILTDKKFYLSHYEFNVSSGIKLGTTSQSNHIVLFKIENDSLRIMDSVTKREIPCTITASSIMNYDGRTYIKQGGQIVEIDLAEIGTKILVSTKVVANVLENASAMYDGVVVQNLLGTYYISVFPTANTHRQIKLPELDKYRIIDAKFDGAVLMVIGTRTLGSGRSGNMFYDRLVFRFGDDWHSYDVRKAENIVYTGLNFTTLDNGVCVCLNEDDELELFSSQKGSATIKIVKDSVLGSDMKLFRNGTSLMFAKGNKLYSIRMK